MKQHKPKQSKEPGLIERVRLALAELTDEWSDHESKGKVSDQDVLRKNTSGFENPFEVAVKTISDSLQQWQRTGGFLRFLRASGADHLVAPHTEVQLEAVIDNLLRFRTSLVRFFVDDQMVGEVVPSKHFPRVWLPYTPTEAGIYTVHFDLLSASGDVLLDRRATEPAFLHVVDRVPVAAIHANLILDENANLFFTLRQLVQQGWALTYFDVEAVDRSKAMYEALLRHQLPIGARFTHSAEEAGLLTLGVDFRHAFARSFAHRLRADGVPIVLMVGDALQSWWDHDEHEIDKITLQELQQQLRQEQGLRKFVDMAHDFIRVRDAAKDRNLRFRLDQRTASKLISGNRCSIEFDNKKARQRLFELIENARQHIHLQFYILRDSSFTDHLATRLIHKARSGVRVRLIVDALYSTQDILGLRNSIVEGLGKEPNIDIVASDPIASASDLEVGALKRRDHRKLIIIDGKIAIVGGRNCSDEYYTGFEEVAITPWTLSDRIPWLDAHVELQGPIVKQVQTCFVANWQRYRGGFLGSARSLYPALEMQGTADVRFIVHEGIDDTYALASFETLIEGARSHLYILNDFPIVASLQTALRKAICRGVQVTLITGNGNARRDDGVLFRGPLHRELFEYMTKKRFEPLLRSGAHIYEYCTPKLPLITSPGGRVRPYVHAKVVTVDGQVASIGSANLDVTASYWEREANVVIEDKQLSQALEQEIQAMVAQSYRIEIDSEYWQREAHKRELSSRLWPASFYS